MGAKSSVSRESHFCSSCGTRIVIHDYALCAICTEVQSASFRLRRRLMVIKKLIESFDRPGATAEAIREVGEVSVQLQRMQSLMEVRRPAA